MPFPVSERVVYDKNPIDSVICQLRFPPILRIDTEMPSKFQDQIRDRFHNYNEKTETVRLLGPPANSGLSNEALQLYSKASIQKNHEFSSDDGIYTVNLSRTFISLSARSYTNWIIFRQQLEGIVAAFVKEYSPPFYVRIGLRYIDIFNKSNLNLRETKWGDLLRPDIIGLLGSDISDHVTNYQTQYEITLADSAGQLRLLSSLVKHRETGEKCVMLDSDFFCTLKTATDKYLGRLDTLHSKSGHMLRWAIKTPLHEAMKPLNGDK